MKENSEIAVIIGAIAAVGIIVYFVYKYLVPKPSPTSTSYNCVNGSCVEVQGTGGQYSTLAECQSACVTTPQVSPIKLSASDTNINPGEIVTFTINGNYPNVYLYACSSQSSAESAVPDGNDFSGQLGQWFLSLKNGRATTQLKPSQIANDTYWVAVASDGTLSNIVEVTTKIVSPSSMTLSGSGSFNQMTFTIKSNSGSSFTAWLYTYNNKAAAENAPPDGGYSSGQLAQYTVSVNNGSGSTVLDPYLISSAAQYWVAVYENSSKAITRSNILTVAPSTSKTTSPPSNSSSNSPSAPTSGNLKITISETGLPSGTKWSINFDMPTPTTYRGTYSAIAPNDIVISIPTDLVTYSTYPTGLYTVTAPQIVLNEEYYYEPLITLVSREGDSTYSEYGVLSFEINEYVPNSKPKIPIPKSAPVDISIKYTLTQTQKPIDNVGIYLTGLPPDAIASLTVDGNGVNLNGFRDASLNLGAGTHTYRATALIPCPYYVIDGKCVRIEYTAPSGTFTIPPTTPENYDTVYHFSVVFHESYSEAIPYLCEKCAEER